MSMVKALPFLGLSLFSILSAAQTVTMSQPTVWAAKPDIAAFEKNQRSAAPWLYLERDKLSSLDYLENKVRK